MLEGELALVCELPCLAGDDDVLVAQRDQRRAEVPAGGSGERLERAFPERAPEHGGVGHQLSLEALERVQARREQPLDRVGELGRGGAALLGDPLHHRLREQGVAAGALGERLGHLRGSAR